MITVQNNGIAHLAPVLPFMIIDQEPINEKKPPIPHAEGGRVERGLGGE